MHRLVRVTSNDYRNFRRAYSKIEYSFFKKGEEQALVSEKVKKISQYGIKGKGEFLDDIENPNNELYFLEIDGEIQGIVHLIFINKECNIHQFSVFEHHKGWGSLFYEEVLKIIKDHGCKKIILWCPFEGAKFFWKKKNFRAKPNSFFEKKL